MTSTGDVILSNVFFSDVGMDEVGSFCTVFVVLMFCFLTTSSGVSTTAGATIVDDGVVMFLGFSTEGGLLLTTTLVTSFGLVTLSVGGLLLTTTTFVSFTLLRFSVFWMGMEIVELSLLLVLLFDLFCCN